MRIGATYSELLPHNAAMTSPPPPFFHADSGSVRFWVLIDEGYVGASVRAQSLHYRYHSRSTDDEPMATYVAHSVEIDNAVRRRVAGGSIEPVMLRESDLPIT